MVVIRVVLAVVLSVAIVGAALPGLETARATATERALTSEAQALQSRLVELTRSNDPVDSSIRGAGRVISIRLDVPPDAGLLIGSPTPKVIAVTRPGHPQRAIATAPVPMVVPGDRPLRIAGNVRLWITYVRRPTGPRLVIRRLSGVHGSLGEADA